MAYRADIEIAVKGAQELRRLQDQVRATSKLVDGLNNYLENIGGGGVVRSIDNLNKAVADTAGAFNKAALGTDEAALAARNFVAANRQLTQGLEERLTLLKSITEQERRQRLSAAGIRETTQYGGAIGPGPASPVGSLVGQKSPVEERIRRTIQARQDESELQQALLRLEQKSVAEANKKLESQEALIRGKREVLALSERETARQKFLAGTSGTAAQGPLAGPGAMGFPVALSLSKVEQEGLATAAKKQAILQRMVATRQALAGLAANLQRLDLNSAVAIADAVRSQEQLNAAKARQLAITQQIRTVEGAASSAARQRLADEAARRNRIQDAGFGVQGPALPPGTGSRRGGGGGRLGGAISGSIIGGAFPLLFGQGAGAAAGGAIGGLAGGLLGPGGSFAGSLLGTLLGDIASKGQQVKELATDIGFTAEQTKRLQQAFALAGSESDKFIESVQNIRGLGLSLDDQADAVLLVSNLTEDYGGKIEKVTNAFTSALESGKVTQATLNQLTSQGIPIQDELAKKYDVNRDKLLQMAKDGKISVQELVDVLVDMGNKGVSETSKTESGFDKLKKSVDSLGSALAALGGSLVGIFQGPFNFILESLALITKTAAESINIISDLLKFSTPTKLETTAAIQAGRMPRGGKQSVIDVIGQDRLSQIEKQAGPGFLGLGTNVPKVLELLKQQPEFKVTTPKIGEIAAPSQLPPSGRTAKGPKPPEDRTQQLTEEFNAIVAIGQAEDKIRNLMFQGRDLLAAEVELEKQLADITRDRNKALISANYESERIVINKIAEARTTDAQLKAEDKIREIRQRRFEEELQVKEAVRSSVQIFTDLRKQQELQLQYSKTYFRLVSEGMLPAEAERIANFEKTVAEQIKAVEQQILLTDAAILEAEARGLSTTELQKQLDILRKQQEAIKGEAAKGPGDGPTDRERLEGALAGAKGQLNELTDPINQIIAGANAIGTAFQQAFSGLVSGAMTGQQALAAFFQGVGDHFMDMASKMIAKLIEIYILETVLGFITGSIGGGGGFGAGGAGFGGSNGFSGFDAGGAFAFGGGGLQPMAEGGFVTGPTSAIIGEGGESEYVIPASKMSAAMQRYGSGARGSAVIPTSGDTSEAGGAPTAMGGAIDVRYSVERINNVEYVTAAQFQAGIRQAAVQGATQGEQRTLRRLQMSASTRRRVGV